MRSQKGGILRIQTVSRTSTGTRQLMRTSRIILATNEGLTASSLPCLRLLSLEFDECQWICCSAKWKYMAE
ncbi:hypothetical protein COLO4_05043 [Corchorus olitorius]|uniref:Uncharacterized protein n=1 Tax=Corchorus olitorius TaxID=93759 RepID=A0A1R3KS07_9ROSI|nr:hypothetical protein COLO4_05043 [Corchorus olitorius]